MACSYLSDCSMMKETGGHSTFWLTGPINSDWRGICGERGGQALSWCQLKAITDVLLPPCGTSYNINGGNLEEQTRCSCTLIVSSVFVTLVSVCLFLNMTKCKKMATTALSDSNICLVLFSSGLKVDGEIATSVPTDVNRILLIYPYT